MKRSDLPPDLRTALERDAGPARPLPPAWRRTLVVGLVTAAVTTLALASMRLRSDLGAMPAWLTWGSLVLQLALGLALVGLALRESIPGAGVPRRAVALALGAAVLAQIAVALATLGCTGAVGPDGSSLAAGVGCMRNDLALALPTFAVTLLLVFRALPLRAPVAGTLGGAGAALTADAVNHLHCPISDLHHVLVWHTGAVLVAAGLGAAAGLVWQTLQWAGRRSR